MSIDALIFYYVVVLLAAAFGVAIYFEHRRRRFETNAQPADNIFRCEKCSFVYTDDGDVERSSCPQCGTINNVIDFEPRRS